MEPLNIKFKTLDDREVEYQLTPLKRKEAALVFHNTLVVVLKAMGEVSADEDKQGALLKALDVLDFETVWGLASKLLRNSIIKSDKGFVEVKNLDECDYFTDRPDEMYLAIFHAVKANFPKFFSGMMAKVGFNPEDLLAVKS